MAIGVYSRAYQTQTRGAVDLSSLGACIGERIKVITELYFEELYIAGENNFIWYSPDPGKSGQINRNYMIMFEDGDFLNHAQVNDELYIRSHNSSFNGQTVKLLEIINGGLGRTDFDFGATEDNDSIDTYYVANVTALKALIYTYGISTGSYTSLTDGSLQKFTIQSSAALMSIISTAMSAVGNKDWQFDILSILGEGDGSGVPDISQFIKLTHEIVVTPLYLAGQYQDMLLGVGPAYFKPDNTLKYNALVDWNKTNTELSDQKRILLDPVGRFGWFNTRFDGAESDYSLTSLTLQRVSDSEFIDQLEYNEVQVVATLTSAAGAFDATDTCVVFGFNYLPEDEALYQNTGRTLDKNFCFDSKRLIADNTLVNGENFGTAAQVIKTVKAEVVSATELKITANILFGADRVTILTQEDVAQYAMWAIIEDIGADIELSDKTNLLLQVSTLHVELTNTDLISAETVFLQHPYELSANGETTLEMFPVDDVVANSLFSIDYTDHEDDDVLFRSCTVDLVIDHATEASIVLDSERINLDGYPIEGSAPGIQAIDFNKLRPYKIEDGIRKSIAFARDFNEDTGNIRYWALNFPFMNRWEYWIKIAGLLNIPGSLFDASVPFNGANHLWNRLANSTGWTLNYRVTFEIQQNGELFQQEFEYPLTSTYFESNTDWNNCNIRSYDMATNDEIIVGPKKYAYSTQDVLIKASFEKTVGTVPALGNVVMVIWAEGFEGGGITEITRISSVYDVTDVSWFRSIDDSDRVVISQVGDVFTGEAILRFDKIQNLSKITLYARIYEVEEIDELDRVTQDFILRLTSDNQKRIVLPLS